MRVRWRKRFITRWLICIIITILICCQIEFGPLTVITSYSENLCTNDLHLCPRTFRASNYSLCVEGKSSTYNNYPWTISLGVKSAHSQFPLQFIPRARVFSLFNYQLETSSTSFSFQVIHNEWGSWGKNIFLRRWNIFRTDSSHCSLETNKNFIQVPQSSMRCIRQCSLRRLAPDSMACYLHVDGVAWWKKRANLILCVHP